MKSLIIGLAMLGAAAGAEPAYDMKVRIEPDTGFVSVKLDITDPPPGAFSLYRGFTVRRAVADGRVVAVAPDPSIEKLPYSPSAQALRVAADRPKRLQLAYEGILAPADFTGLWSVNGIDRDRVELGLYSAWFPIFRQNGALQYRLSLDLPKDYVAVANGEAGPRTVRGKRAVSTFVRDKSGHDIALLASPRFHTHRSHDGSIVFYALGQSAEILERNAQGLAEGQRWLSSLWGAPEVGTMRIAYAQRSQGGGYSRLPLIVVTDPAQPAGKLAGAVARAHYHYLAHEMAHFWWMIADQNSAEGWIDEGLAQYAADRLADRRFGKLTASEHAGVAAARFRTNQTASAINDVLPNSPDREVFWYHRTALMMHAAEEKFGEAAIDRMLRALYQSRHATEASFLATARKVIGPEAESFFRTELSRKYPAGTAL